MKILSKVIKGFQSASGLNGKYEGGTIGIQRKYIETVHELKEYMDINECFMGTVNVDVSNFEIELGEPDYILTDIKWIETFPKETFYIYKCQVTFKDVKYNGIIYVPIPNKETDFLNRKKVLEVITYKIPGINYGEDIEIEF